MGRSESKGGHVRRLYVAESHFATWYPANPRAARSGSKGSLIRHHRIVGHERTSFLIRGILLSECVTLFPDSSGLQWSGRDITSDTFIRHITWPAVYDSCHHSQLPVGCLSCFLLRPLRPLLLLLSL